MKPNRIAELLSIRHPLFQVLEEGVKALSLGAEGVWLDTRFLATADSGAHDDYKKRLVAARSTETVLIPRCSTRAGRTRRIALYAGQSVGLIRDLPPVGSVIAELARAFVYIQVFGNISQLDPVFCQRSHYIVKG